MEEVFEDCHDVEVVYQRCCGLDIHKKMIVACLIILGADGKRRKQIRTFGTTTAALLELLDWWHPAPSRANAARATENDAVLCVIARIISSRIPLESQRARPG